MNNNKTSEASQASEARETYQVVPGDERLKAFKNVTIIPNEIRDMTHLSIQARYLWIELWGYCWGKDNSEAFPSQKTLMERLGVSKPSLLKYISELEDAGLLEVEHNRKKGFNNTYFLFSPFEKAEYRGSEGGCKNSLHGGLNNFTSKTFVGDDETDERGQNQGSNKYNRINTSLTTEDSHNSQRLELFESVNSKELNDKSNDALNVNELIATLQTHALDAGVVFEAEKVDAGKLRGQVKHLKDELAGSGNVVKFYKWFFSDPRRLNRFKRAPNSFKLHKVMDELSNYKTVQRKSRENERMGLIIDLTGPTSQYSREDLTGLTLEELEELERDMREQVEENEQSMAKARAKMG